MKTVLEGLFYGASAGFNHPSSWPPHEPGKHSTFNIQRPTSKAGAKRSALKVPSWALKVECFPCGSGAQGVNISGRSLPVEGRRNADSRGGLFKSTGNFAAMWRAKNRVSWPTAGNLLAAVYGEIIA
jgi:hypothetical protein